MIKTSSGLPQKSSAIFRNLQKFSENVLEHLSGLRNNFGKSSKIFVKWSKIFGKSSKNAVISNVYIIKRTLHVNSKI